MMRSPVTARIIIEYTEGGKLSTALIEDLYGRRRSLFTCPHGQVVARIARWTEDNHFDHCEIRCERKSSSGTADAASS